MITEIHLGGGGEKLEQKRILSIFLNIYENISKDKICQYKLTFIDKLQLILLELKIGLLNWLMSMLDNRFILLECV